MDIYEEKFYELLDCDSLSVRGVIDLAEIYSKEILTSQIDNGKWGEAYILTTLILEQAMCLAYESDNVNLANKFRIIYESIDEYSISDINWDEIRERILFDEREQMPKEFIKISNKK